MSLKRKVKPINSNISLCFKNIYDLQLDREYSQLNYRRKFECFNIRAIERAPNQKELLRTNKIFSVRKSWQTDSDSQRLSIESKLTICILASK